MKTGWTKWILLSATVGGLMAVVADGQAVVAQEKGGGDVTGPDRYVGTGRCRYIPTDGPGVRYLPCGRVGRWVLVFMRGEKPAMREVPARGDIKGRALGLLEGVRAQVDQQSRFDGMR